MNMSNGPHSTERTNAPLSPESAVGRIVFSMSKKPHLIGIRTEPQYSGMSNEAHLNGMSHEPHIPWNEQPAICYGNQQ